jgi:hypothetical protein
MEDQSNCKTQNTNPETLLEAAIRFYEKQNPAAREFMELGFKIAQPDGWKQVAPAWVERMGHYTGNEIMEMIGRKMP